MSTVVGGLDTSLYCAENNFGKIGVFIWKVSYQTSHINVIGLHEKLRVNSTFNVVILLAKQFWIQLLFDYEYFVLEINIWEAGLLVLKAELLQFVYQT